MYSTLISAAVLDANLDTPDWAIIDCRFSLTDTELGQRDYLAAHIPGAIYAHLDNDLSSPHEPGKTGRHPLPPVEEFVRTLSRWGIDDEVQVVVYDDQGGMIAGRLWWMLRWLGHPAVALLDGGWRQWQREGRPVAAGITSRPPRRFTPHLHPEMTAEVAEVAARLSDPTLTLLDARGADRYRGENETIDPRAGHIPGALSAPYAANLDADGRFFPADVLRSRWRTLLGDTPATEAIVYCGSGVSAAHNLLAMEYAGLGMGRLYAGSWSHWITDPARPVATGATP